MIQRKQRMVTKKRGALGEEDQHFYEYIAAPLEVWQWSETTTPEMNKLAMRDLLAALGRAKELFPYAKCVSVRDGGSWGSNGHHFIPYNTEAFSRLKQVEAGLKRNRWDWACHEFHDVLSNCSAVDKGILFQLIQIVENHIWESENEEAKRIREALENLEREKMERAIAQFRESHPGEVNNP